MRRVSATAIAVLGGIVMITLFGGCRSVSETGSSDPVLAEAWNAWAAGDFQGARTLSEALVAEPVTSDAGHFMLALVSHVTGEYEAAIEHFGALSRRYPGRRALAETILESYLLLRDVPGARQFAREQRLGASVRRALDAVIQRPFRVEIDGVAVLPFVDDPLTPMMLGVAARINGHETVARLDTGGTFVHVSEEQARLWGIETVANERTFASLATMTVRFGLADFELGPVRLTNVPVTVHPEGLASDALAQDVGVELGPIFGTNVLQQFLSTIDPHAGRLILSSRDDPDARAEHEALLAAGRLGDNRETLIVPFVMWGDHLMIAPGSVAGQRDANLFIDSGLVAFNAEYGQAAFLASSSRLQEWGATMPDGESLVRMEDPIGLVGAPIDGLVAYAVPDSMWEGLGDWGGIRVDGLLSWDYLRRFVWTVDFDEREYRLTIP